MSSSESNFVFVTDCLSMVTLIGLSVDSRGGRGCQSEQTTIVEVGNKGRKDSGFVTDGSLTLVTLTGLGQLIAACP